MIPGKHPYHPSFKRSFLFAQQGFRLAFHQERNIKVMLSGALGGVIVGIIVHFDALSWLIFALCCAVVIAAELLNTAIEKAVDLVSPEFHPLAGQAKDIAAAAVWSMCIIVALIGAGLVLRALGWWG